MELVGLLLMVALPTLAGWGLYSAVRQGAHDQAESWKRVAAAAGLEDVEIAWRGVLGSSPCLTGRAGRLRVELSTSKHSEAQLTYRFVVGGLGYPAADLMLHREDLGSRVAKTLGRRELEIGDPAFDDQLYVRGSRALAHAIFDAETRLRTIRLFADESARVWLSEGALHYESADSQVMPSWVEGQLPIVLDVARQLSRPADIPGRLAANARRDPLPSARVATILVLAREFPDLPVTRETLKASLDDPSAHVRLGAASALGEEGDPCLSELARAPGGSEEIQTEALWALGDRLPLEEGEEILSEALRLRRVPVAQAVLRAFGRKGGPGVVASLTKVLAVGRGELAVAAARALGDCGEPAGEGALVTALDRTDEGLAIASTEALGRVGSASAVPKLRKLEEATDDDSLRRAARQAIAQIQARLGDASPGQLSLAEGDSGQLSLTEDETGRVSLPDDEA